MVSFKDVLIEEGMSESLGAGKALFGVVFQQALHQVENLLQLCCILSLVVLKREILNTLFGNLLQRVETRKFSDMDVIC